MLGSIYRSITNIFNSVETITRTVDTSVSKAEELALIHLNIQVEEAKASAVAAQAASQLALSQPGAKTAAAIAERRKAILAEDVTPDLIGD